MPRQSLRVKKPPEHFEVDHLLTAEKIRKYKMRVNRKEKKKVFDQKLWLKKKKKSFLKKKKK